MTKGSKAVLPVIGVIAGAVCAWLIAGHGRTGAGAVAGKREGTGTAIASVASKEPATERAEARSSPATTAIAAATQPTTGEATTLSAVPQAIRLGDEVLTPERWMRRVVATHGVYVTYDDSRVLWHFKEPAPGAPPDNQPGTQPATQASTEPATGEPRPAEAFAQAIKAGATPIPAGQIPWPAVSKMDVVEPLERMQARFPAQNGPLVRTVGSLLVGVNDVAQAEDGTFFVICTERWNDGTNGGGKELPEMQVEGSTDKGGMSMGKVAEVSAPMERPVMRVMFYMMVPGDAVRAGKKLRLRIKISGVTEPVTADMEAEAVDVSLRDAAESIDDFCQELDGIAAVRLNDYTLAQGRGGGGAAAGLEESAHRPGEYLPGEFTGRVLTQVALRHQLLARSATTTQSRPATGK